MALRDKVRRLLPGGTRVAAAGDQPDSRPDVDAAPAVEQFATVEAAPAELTAASSGSAAPEVELVVPATGAAATAPAAARTPPAVRSPRRRAVASASGAEAGGAEVGRAGAATASPRRESASGRARAAAAPAAAGRTVVPRAGAAKPIRGGPPPGTAANRTVAARTVAAKPAAPPARAEAVAPVKAAKAPVKAAKPPVQAAKAPAKAAKAPAKAAEAPAKVAEAPAKAVKVPAKAVKAPAKAVKSPAKAASPAAPPAPRSPEDEWTPAELSEVRGELQQQATQLTAELAQAEAASETLKRAQSAEGSGDEADAGSMTFEREHEMSLTNNSRDLLQQVQRALGRLDGGTYGLCEDCGSPIPKARLQAFPRATLCVACKQREERR